MKVLPNDYDAEQCVIGCCLIDEYSKIQAVEELTDNDFYAEINKVIFACIMALFNRNEPVDIITIKNELISIDQFDRVGGIDYLSSLTDKVPTTANIEQYIKIVKDKSILRDLIEMSNEISRFAYDSTSDVSLLTETAERKIFEISQRGKDKGASNLKDLLQISINNLEDVVNNGKKQGLSTGFVDLDKRIGGLKGSELIVVAARPGMGKSAFALNIAMNVSKMEKVPVLIFSLEMGKNQLTDRIICSESLIDNKRYSEGKLEDEEWPKLAESMNIVSESANVFIDDNSSINISEMKAKCRKMVMDENVGLVVIDYLQLIRPVKTLDSRVREVSELSRELKLLANELNIPIIALSQLSRANEKGTGKEKVRKPLLSDLRDSGSIEQDADIVMLIHREGYYGTDKVKPGEENIAEINVAKFRRGETGVENLLWLGNYTKFVNISKREE